MKLTIVPADKMIIVDGVPVRVPDAAYPAGVHAIQWYGDKGEIEYTNAPGEPKPLNKAITDVTPYLPLVEAWKVEKARQDAEREKEWAK